MDNLSKDDAPGGIEYEYSREVIENYRKSPTEWKLNWLEEVNRLTFLVLDEKQKSFREKFRRGEIG
jgi:hypothetical protein